LQILSCTSIAKKPVETGPKKLPIPAVFASFVRSDPPAVFTTESNYAVGIHVTAATKLARAAASSGMSAAQFIEATMARVLADAGYIEDEETSEVA
jgi:hypothetical protein